MQSHLAAVVQMWCTLSLTLPIRHFKALHVMAANSFDIRRRCRVIMLNVRCIAAALPAGIGVAKAQAVAVIAKAMVSGKMEMEVGEVEAHQQALIKLPGSRVTAIKYAQWEFEFGSGSRSVCRPARHSLHRVAGCRLELHWQL